LVPAPLVTSFTPQAWKFIRSRFKHGLSLRMFALTCRAFAAWTSFNVLKGEWTLIIPNAVCTAFALFILMMIALPNRQTKIAAEKLDPTG
jgi:MtN3 and saliva related transmembrane protein